MATTTDDGFHEIQLNGKQLVFLFMAVTVVSVVIFLCGVLVGRGVRPEPSGTDAFVAQPTPPPAPEPPAAAAATSDTPSATTKENLTYPERLASAGAAEERLRKTPPPARTVAPRTVTPAPSAPPAQVAPAASPAAAEPAGPGFAIQLAALGKRDEADGLARRLTGKGYRAYVIAPSAGGPTVFRVRVGKFKDLREAESVKARLEKEEQFNPWIVR